MIPEKGTVKYGWARGEKGPWLVEGDDEALARATRAAYKWGLTHGRRIVTRKKDGRVMVYDAGPRKGGGRR